MDRLIGQRPFDEKHHEAVKLEEKETIVISENGADHVVQEVEKIKAEDNEVKPF